MPLIKRGKWDSNKHLRGALILSMTVCSIAAPIDWANWAKGTVSVWFPVALTAGALLVFFAVPRKLELITLTFGLAFVLSILGTVLRRAPLDIGLGIVFATGVLYFGCVYLGERSSKHKGK
jgi:hypothetical protein